MPENNTTQIVVLMYLKKMEHRKPVSTSFVEYITIIKANKQKGKLL